MEKPNLLLRLKKGLSKTHQGFVGSLDRLFSGKKQIDQDLIDELEERGFEVTPLSGRTEEILKPYFAPWSEPKNPVDIMYSAISYGFKTIYQVTLKALLEDPLIDAVLCVCGYPTIKTIAAD